MNWHELAILALLFRKKELAFEVNENIFDDPKTLSIFHTTKSLLKHGKEVTTKELSLLLGSDYDKYLKKLRKLRRDPPDEELVLRMLGNKIVKNKLLEVAPLLAKLELEDYEELKAAIKDAESLPANSRGMTMGSFAEKVGDYSEYKTTELEKFPLPIKNVYLYPGEVGVVVAPPKGGKTTALVNIASLALIHGHKVGFWELERPEDEMMERFSQRMIGEINFVKAAKRIRRMGGELVLRTEPYCTPRELRSWVINDHLDMLIVDYFDYIKIHKMKERRFEISEIYQFARNISKEFLIPVWTASQSTAKSIHKKWITLEDLEEAKISKSGIASLMIGINQNEEEKEENVARTNIIVSTHGFKAGRLCEFDYSKQLWRELKKKEDE